LHRRRSDGWPTKANRSEPGSVANLAIWDPSVETTVSGEALASRSGNTPYAGYTLPGAVRHVLFRGRPSVVDGGLA